MCVCEVKSVSVSGFNPVSFEALIFSFTMHNTASCFYLEDAFKANGSAHFQHQLRHCLEVQKYKPLK